MNDSSAPERDAPEQCSEPGRLAAPLLRRILDVTADLIVLLDADNRILWANEAARSVLGRDPADLVGAFALDFFAKRERNAHQLEAFAEVLSAPGPHGAYPATLAKPDGEFIETEMLLHNALDDPSLGAVVACIRDVTRRPGALEELQRREAWADALIRRGSELIMVSDRWGVVSYANPTVERVLGMARQELVGTCWLDLVVDDQKPRGARELLDHLLAASRERPVLLRIGRPDGVVRQLSVHASQLSGDPDVAGVVVNAVDVTESSEAEHLLAEQAELLEAMARGLPLESTLLRIAESMMRQVPGSIVMCGVMYPDGWVRYPAVPSGGEALGSGLDAMRPDTEIGQGFRAMTHEPAYLTDPNQRWWDAFSPEVAALGMRSLWLWPTLSHHSGELVGSLNVFVPEEREPTAREIVICERALNLAAIAIDRHRLEALLEHRARHDVLTGLPNRASLRDAIEERLAAARATGRSVAVMFIDLDRFKVINDSLGHSVGDELLAQVASRFSAALRPADIVGRFGGDEFVVVCGDLDGSEDAVWIAERLRRTLAPPFALVGRELSVTASIGIAHVACGDAPAEALVRDADVAMYRSKSRGRDTFSLFEVGDREELFRTLELESALRAAIDRDAIDIHLQPIVRTEDRSIVGFEALVRWEQPGSGFVSPAELISMTEDSGLTSRLSRRVLEAACGFAVGLDGTGPEGGPWVSVNVSARHFVDPELAVQVEAVLGASGLAPSRLCLELTETALVGDQVLVAEALSRLKALGVRLAIDDFGTGHATLDYTRRFAAADMLKLDSSFVSGLEDEAGHDRAILRAVLALGSSLSLTVIAEGVETEGQLRVLREADCELAQGYLFARPAPPDQAAALMEWGIAMG